MEVGGPDVICVLPASEDEKAGPVSSSFSLRTKPQLPQTNSPLSSSLTKVPFFPQFGQLSGISLLSLSVGSWADDNCERLQCGRPLFTQALPDGSARMILRRRRNEPCARQNVIESHCLGIDHLVLTLLRIPI